MGVPGEEMEKGDASQAIRIYVGGLGENVTAEDLKKTFSTPQLGKVESMDIVRTKGRSFAYLDLLPSSDKSLPKLFSTYNGCMWKGGRLRIEKAKEHFFIRMKREWEEDAALATTSVHLPVTATEMTNPLKDQKKVSKLDDMQLRIYFPKLGKIRPVPFRGTGKHKYSFQRVEVPLLPIHFCDCEEHSAHPNTSKQKSCSDYDSKDGGMGEKELNIMNSVLNKIFERENYQAPRDFRLAKKVRSSTSVVDHLQNDKNLLNQEMENDDNLILNVVAGATDRTTMLKDPAQEAMTASQVNENFVDQEIEEIDDDDDNLVINVVAGGNNKTKDPAQEAIAAMQNLLSMESRLATDKQRQGRKASSNRKRKALSENEVGEAHTLPSKPEAKGSLNTLICDRADLCPSEVKSGSQPSNSSAKFQKKSPWKDLVSASSAATFSVSDILPSSISGKDMQPGSEGVRVSHSSDKKDEKVSDQHEELDKVAKDSTNDLNVPVDTYARGAAWRQKSSWTQLIRDTTSSSFSISHVLPGLSLPEPELPMMGETGKVQNSSRTDISNSQDVSADQGVKADGLGAPGTCNGGVLPEERKNVHFNKGLPDLDNYQEEGKTKNEALTPIIEKKLPSVPKQAFVGDTNFSETCSFMRSASSMKEWMKTKAALSGSLKNKSNEKK